ncbi:MAG: transcription elongation factor GreA [Candidatus Omnitrophota bacterium]
MASDYINLTRDGRDKICKELEHLKGAKRREIAKALAEARAHGDLSENAEYDAAKEMQAMNEKKVAHIEGVLMKARIVDNEAIAKDEALLGATIKVREKNSGDQCTYMLVSEEESDFDEDKISVTSPVGKALLGHKVGDIVDVTVPAGTLKYEILEINR